MKDDILLELEQNVIDDLQSSGKSVVDSKSSQEFNQNSLLFFKSLKGFEKKYKEGLADKGLPPQKFSMSGSFLQLWTAIVNTLKKWEKETPDVIKKEWEDTIQKHKDPEKAITDVSDKMEKRAKDKENAHMVGMIMANLFQKQYENVVGNLKGFEAPSKQEAEKLLKNRELLSEVVSGILKVLFKEDKERVMESFEDMKKRVKEGLLNEGIEYESDNSLRVKAELVEHYLTDPEFLEMDKHSRINLIHTHLAGEVSTGNITLQEANAIKKEYMEAEGGFVPDVETELTSDEATGSELEFIKKKIFSLVDQEVENQQEAQSLKKEIESNINGLRSGNLETMKFHAEDNPEGTPESFENLSWNSMDEGDMVWYFIYKGLGELFKPLEFAEWATGLTEGKKKRIGYGFPYWWGRDHEGDGDLDSGIGGDMGGGGE